VKRAERERLIERYLNGDMTLSEEQDFFIEVASDRELRTELKAYRIVENAVRKDSTASAVSYVALRSHMAAVLGAGAAKGGGGGESIGPAPSAAPAPALPPAAAATPLVSVGALSLKWLATLGAVGAVVVSTALLWFPVQDAPLRTAPADSVVIRSAEPPASVPVLPGADVVPAKSARAGAGAESANAEENQVRKEAAAGGDVKSPAHGRISDERERPAARAATTNTSRDADDPSTTGTPTDKSSKISVVIEEPRNDR